MDEVKTKGVSTLLGNPKNAVLKLSIPMIIAMVINSLYAFIDGVWVAGLGDVAIAAIGFVNPIYLIVFGFSNGLGAGATAVISRYIGAKDKKQADNSALHVLLLSGILTIITTIGLLLFLRNILGLLGAGLAIDLCLDYGNIMFAGSVFIVFSSVFYGILRAEGNVNKTTYAMLFGAIINIILDPIFIYYLNLGIAGAAIASVFSMALVTCLLLYWFKNDTYIKFNFESFKYTNTLVKKILIVGLPAGAEFLIISILTVFFNLILLIVSGINGVAIYTAGWRLVLVAMVPIIAIGMSMVAVTGANFGASKFENINIIHNYGIKIGFIISVGLTISIFLLAPYISYLFTYSPESQGLRTLITDFLRITSLFYLSLPFGVASTSIFQGLGRGLDSFFLTLIRLLILEVIFAYILAIPLGLGQYGVWYAIIIANALGSTIAFIWAKRHIHNLISSNTS